MTRIFISSYEGPEAISRAMDFLEQERAQNPNWNGAQFDVSFDDYTCIPDDESYDAAALLSGIQNALQGTSE